MSSTGSPTEQLAAVRDPARVAAAVAAALGIRDLPSAAAADALARALAHRHLLLVLDNCEHVIGAAAELCGRLLLGADDVRVLATSREPLRIAGEVRYRLGPLTVPDPGDLATAAESEAVTLFADRAWLVDPGFALDEATTAAVGQLVSRLDGLLLAIELAAARVDVLGLAQLLERIDDRFALLADGDRLADGRQRSLAAAVAWSYELLHERERRVFRAVSVFPGPFTLEGAEAVAGTGAGPAVLRLVDRSLLLPPQVGPDGRSRYLMLETLRAYGAGLMAEAGEDGAASAALAAYAVDVAEEAVLGLRTRTWEVAGIRHLDAEDVTLRHALAWAMEHDQAAALRLALALAPWWQLRGRLMSQVPLLAAAAEQADYGSDEWCMAGLWPAEAARQAADPLGALRHFTAVCEVLEDPGRSPSPSRPALLAICLGGRSKAQLYLDRVAEAETDGRRALDLAHGYSSVEAIALACLTVTAWSGGDRERAIRLARQAQEIPEEFSGTMHRTLSQIVTLVLTEAGELAAAEEACLAGEAWCREVGDLRNLAGQLRSRAILDLRAGRVKEAAAHLHEQVEIIKQTGLRPGLTATLDCCGHLCAASGRPAEAVTVWAAMSALAGPWRLPSESLNAGRRDELLHEARQRLGPARARAAEERGAAMSRATAAEYVLILAAAEPPPRQPPTTADVEAAASARNAPREAAAGPRPAGAPAEVTGLDLLSPRERELVTLVAQGRTDAQIAAQLYISARTVGSHLDRIRDKTGCRRRADLTRLALSAGLV
jgi:predicted ATPase/DNA-binding CsgD family transcriptional regulator